MDLIRNYKQKNKNKIINHRKKQTQYFNKSLLLINFLLTFNFERVIER